MYFLVDCETQKVVARFSSKGHGLMLGPLMARQRRRAFELRWSQGGPAMASFSAAGEITRLDN
jgi:hypothetical protein